MGDTHPTSGSADGFVREVVGKIADDEGVAELELPPLGPTIDCDALIRLIDSMDNGEVVFHYVGYQITVAADSEVTIDTTG